MADHIKSTRHSHPCSLNLCLSILNTKYDRPRTSLISAETAVFCITAELAAVRTSAILRKHVDVLHVTLDASKSAQVATGYLPRAFKVKGCLC